MSFDAHIVACISFSSLVRYLLGLEPQINISLSTRLSQKFPVKFWASQAVKRQFHRVMQFYVVETVIKCECHRGALPFGTNSKCEIILGTYNMVETQVILPS